MRHFQMHVYRKTHFHLLVYRRFRMASTTCGRHSHQAPDTPQMGFHQARVEEMANSLLKDGAKIHLKNDRNSTEERAENSEPKWTPNPTSMCATLIKSRIYDGAIILASTDPRKAGQRVAQSCENALRYIYNIIYILNIIHIFIDIFLKFHTLPQISPMRAQRAPVSS